jgi:hypothetical protein
MQQSRPKFMTQAVCGFNDYNKPEYDIQRLLPGTVCREFRTVLPHFRGFQMYTR